MKNPNGHLQKAPKCSVVPNNALTAVFASLTLCTACRTGTDSKHFKNTAFTLNGTFTVPFLDCPGNECRFQLTVTDMFTKDCFPASDTTCTGAADCTHSHIGTITIIVDPVNDDITSVDVISNPSVPSGSCCNLGGLKSGFLGNAGPYAFGAAIANVNLLASCTTALNNPEATGGTSTVTKV